MPSTTLRLTRKAAEILATKPNVSKFVANILDEALKNGAIQRPHASVSKSVTLTHPLITRLTESMQHGGTMQSFASQIINDVLETYDAPDNKHAPAHYNQLELPL